MKDLTRKLWDFTKTNISYVKSDAYGFVFSQAPAYLTSFTLNRLDVSHEWNVAITLGVKTAGFFLGKFLSTKKDEREKIILSTIIGKSISSLGPLGHLVALNCEFILKDLSYPAGYSFFGFLGTGVRWYMDFKSGAIKKPVKK